MPIRRSGGLLAFAAPPLVRSGPPSAAELDEALRFLGIGRDAVCDAAWIDNGPGWLGIRLASADAVLALAPAGSWPGRIDLGVVGPSPPGRGAAIEVRAFFSNGLGSIVEDPVTGSLNASVAQWLYATGVVSTSYIAAQGARVDRDGRIHVSSDADGTIWIGGSTRTLVEGALAGLTPG